MHAGIPALGERGTDARRWRIQGQLGCLGRRQRREGKRERKCI